MWRLLALALSSVSMLGCALLSMDAFEDWEPASTDYLAALPPEVRDGFTDDAHALAYALAVDCFKTDEPESVRDISVREACQTGDWGWLSDVMTMRDLCDYALADGSVDVPRINEGMICG